MGERSDLEGIDALGFHQGARQTINFLEGLDRVDIAVLYLKNNLQDVGGTEHLAILLVELDVGVARRVQIEEIGMDTQL